MKEWYEKKYFNRMYWLFEEMENLNLNDVEFTLIMLIQYLNDTKTPITFDLLQKKMKKSEEEIDDLFNQLNRKGYLTIDVTSNGFEIDITGLFRMESELHFDKDIFALFESEFKKPLSSMELQRLSDWLQEYDEESIKFALREASLRNILNFNYIQRILENGMNDEEK